MKGFGETQLLLLERLVLNVAKCYDAQIRDASAFPYSAVGQLLGQIGNTNTCAPQLTDTHMRGNDKQAQQRSRGGMVPSPNCAWLGAVMHAKEHHRQLHLLLAGRWGTLGEPCKDGLMVKL